MSRIVKNGMRVLILVCVAVASLAAQQGAPQTAPPKQVPGYVIGQNDVLKVTVYSGGISQPDFLLNNYTVQTDGTIALPLIKPIKVAGLSVNAANAAIKKALEETRQFTECIVDITMMQYRSSLIRVQGAVRNPGNVEMTADRMNVSDALNKVNGLQPSAGAQIRVKRANGKASEEGVTVVDGWEVYAREDLDNGKLADVQLYDGDWVDVPVAPKYFVQGFVTTPGEMQWEPNLTLEHALIKVGGVTKEGDKNRVEITRLDPQTKQIVKVKLAKNKMSTIIEPNDSIEVKKRRW